MWKTFLAPTKKTPPVIKSKVKTIEDNDKKTVFSNYTMMRIIRIAIIAICILIVSIPEGLPLAVSVAMALSISKMKSDNILIKNVEAV